MYLTCLVDSLKCWTCTFGKCLTGINYFGVEKTCKGFEPVCVKKESENKISRTCHSSDAFVHLKSLDSTCLTYSGVKICYCTRDNCNSVSKFSPNSTLTIISVLLLSHVGYAKISWPQYA